MKRRIKVTYNGTKFVAEVHEFRSDSSWWVCTEGAWGQWQAHWEAKTPAKAYQKALAYVTGCEASDVLKQMQAVFTNGTPYVEERGD